jgi:hypothetical protein
MESSNNGLDNNYMDYIINIIKRFEIKNIQDLINKIIIQYLSLIDSINTNIPLIMNIIEENKLNIINNNNNNCFNYNFNFNIVSDTTNKLNEKIKNFTNLILKESNNNNNLYSIINNNNNINPYPYPNHYLYPYNNTNPNPNPYTNPNNNNNINLNEKNKFDNLNTTIAENNFINNNNIYINNDEGKFNLKKYI